MLTVPAFLLTFFNSENSALIFLCLCICIFQIESLIQKDLTCWENKQFVVTALISFFKCFVIIFWQFRISCILNFRIVQFFDFEIQARVMVDCGNYGAVVKFGSNIFAFVLIQHFLKFIKNSIKSKHLWNIYSIY